VRKKYKSQLCIYCGVREATDRDHIPPKGIYPPQWRNNRNLHKVPSCSDCHQYDSIADEEFKLYINIWTGEFRENQDDVIDTMARTIGENQRLASQIFSTATRGYADRGRGILEPVVYIGFNYENYRKVIKRISRGLYWTETKKIMSSKIDIRVVHPYEMNNYLKRYMQNVMNSLEKHELNYGTFVYKCCFSDNGLGILGMQFFSRHTVIAYTVPC